MADFLLLFLNSTATTQNYCEILNTDFDGK